MLESSRYNFKLIEEKWQTYWLKNKSFKAKIDNQKPKFYCLEMFFIHGKNSYGTCKKLYYWRSHGSL